MFTKVHMGGAERHPSFRVQMMTFFMALLFCLAFMATAVSNKQIGPFVDEIFSYCLANISYIGHPLYFPQTMEAYSYDILKNGYEHSQYAEDRRAALQTNAQGIFLFASDGPILARQTMEDLLMPKPEARFGFGSVYWNQCLDVHPPLYYFLLHAVCSVFHGEFSVWHGLGINLCFYILSLVLIYCIMRDVSGGNHWLSLLSMCFYGFSVGAVSTVALIRMYMMLAFCTLLFTYFLVHGCIHSREPLSFKSQAALGISVILGGMTNHFFLVYMVICSAFLGIYLWILQKKEILLQYLRTIVLSYGTVLLLFPFTLVHLLYSDHGAENISSRLSDGHVLWMYVQSIHQYVCFARDALLGGAAGYAFLAILAVLCVQYMMKGSAYVLSVVPLCSVYFLGAAVIVYIICVSMVTMYKSERYIMNIYPICAVLITGYGYEFCCRYFKRYAIEIMVAMIAFVMIAHHFMAEPNYLYAAYSNRYEILSQYQDKPCIYVYQDDANGIWDSAALIREFSLYSRTAIIPLSQLAQVLEEMGKEQGFQGEILLYVGCFGDKDCGARIDGIVSTDWNMQHLIVGTDMLRTPVYLLEFKNRPF